jgi:hypothetical protein
MKTSEVFFWSMVILIGNGLLIVWFLCRFYPVPKEVQEFLDNDISADEHTQCDCVGCGSSCCDCAPVPGDSTVDSLLADQHYLCTENPCKDFAANSISNSVVDIINTLRDSNKALDAVIKQFGYNNLQDLSTAQLLTIDDKLYCCNLCGYWSDHVNSHTSKYAALWTCPHCKR